MPPLDAMMLRPPGNRGDKPPLGEREILNGPDLP